MIHRNDVSAATRRMLDLLVRDVAEASVETVCGLVVDRVLSMSLCEARGYTRARAGSEVRRQLRKVLAQRSDVHPAWRPAIVQRASERVAPLVLRQLTAARARSAESRLFGPAMSRRVA